jgi:hypothetical protein
MITLLFCLVMLGAKKNSDQNIPRIGESMPPTQFSQLQGNELEIITSMYGFGLLNGRLGECVKGIGDINMDGYDDVLVGNVHNGPGEALILFGGADMDSLPDLILRGEGDGDLMGTNAFGGCDINGDGMPDLLVQAGGYPNHKQYGRVYGYFGGTLLDTIPDIVLTGKSYMELFGFRMAAGDVNGDQCADVLISTISYNTCSGKAYLYYGGSLLDTIPDWINRGDSIWTYLGCGLAIGDVNSDGKNDVIINSGPWIDRKDYLAVTELFLQSDKLDTVATFAIIDTGFKAFHGNTLYIKDFNLDGADDFIIKQLKVLDNKYYGYNIYFGGTDLDTKPDAFIAPWYGGTNYILADAGDVNGDGWPDIITGEWDGQFEAGAIELFLGSARINYDADWLCGGVGYSVDGAGDVNGDGYDDLITSSVTLPFTHVATGRVYIFAGKPGLTDIGTSVEQIKEKELSPTQILFQNYPNPFNIQTTIRYLIANKFGKYVSLTVFDITGKEVINLVNRWQLAGEYSISWDGTDQQGENVSSGMYLCHLLIGNQQQVKKLMLLE